MSKENEGQSDPEGEELSVQELENKIAQLEKDKSSLTGEIQDVRKSKQELQEEIDQLKEEVKNTIKNSPKEGQEDVEKIASVVKQVLGERDASEAEKAKTAAFEKFVAENKEFHPDNDVSGLRLEALKKKFGTFNTSGLKNEKDFLSVLEDSKKLLPRTDNAGQTEEEPEPNDDGSPAPGGGTPPNSIPKSKLTEQEKRVLVRTGMSEERYLKLKKKDPRYIEDLLNWTR